MNNFLEICERIRCIHEPGGIRINLLTSDSTMTELEASVILKKYASQVIADQLKFPMQKFGELLFQMKDAGYIKHGSCIPPNLNRQKPWTSELAQLLYEVNGLFEKVRSVLYINEKGQLVDP
tara:strand:+ start:1216 stop:1581 length:366 start_codon:yes stop_codon:yes gene_type:complete